MRLLPLILISAALTPVTLRSSEPTPLPGKGNILSVVEAPSSRRIDFEMPDFEALAARFGRECCERRNADGIEFALCYETWTSSHVRGYLHVYQFAGERWVLCGIAVCRSPLYKVTKVSAEGVEISFESIDARFWIPFYTR